MQLDFHTVDDILMTRIAGELDHYGAAKTREEIDKTIDASSCKHLVMDFAGVSFMDSSGIGVVMGRYKKVKDKGGKVYITGCSEYVRKILEMAGIFTIINQSSNTENAICSIQGKIPMQMTMEVIMNG
jgi:stage II sporulation protein AA (anti-sigma F factor antagonist)